MHYLLWTTLFVFVSLGLREVTYALPSNTEEVAFLLDSEHETFFAKEENPSPQNTARLDQQGSRHTMENSTISSSNSFVPISPALEELDAIDLPASENHPVGKIDHISIAQVTPTPRPSTTHSFEHEPEKEILSTIKNESDPWSDSFNEDNDLEGVIFKDADAKLPPLHTDVLRSLIFKQQLPFFSIPDFQATIDKPKPNLQKKHEEFSLALETFITNNPSFKENAERLLESPTKFKEALIQQVTADYEQAPESAKALKEQINSLFSEAKDCRDCQLALESREKVRDDLDPLAKKLREKISNAYLTSYRIGSEGKPLESSKLSLTLQHYTKISEAFDRYATNYKYRAFFLHLLNKAEDFGTKSPQIRSFTKEYLKKAISYLYHSIENLVLENGELTILYKKTGDLYETTAYACHDMSNEARYLFQINSIKEATERIDKIITEETQKPQLNKQVISLLKECVTIYHLAVTNIYKDREDCSALDDLISAGEQLEKAVLEARKPQPNQRIIALLQESAALYQQSFTAWGEHDLEKNFFFREAARELEKAILEIKKPQSNEQVIALLQELALLYQQGTTSPLGTVENLWSTVHEYNEKIIAIRNKPPERVIALQEEAAALSQQAADALARGEKEVSFVLNNAAQQLEDASKMARETKPNEEAILLLQELATAFQQVAATYPNNPEKAVACKKKLYELEHIPYVIRGNHPSDINKEMLSFYLKKIEELKNNLK